MATSKPKTETAKTDETPKTGGEIAQASTTSTELAEADAYAAYAGSGFENQTSADYAIPFLSILQALSPQVQENEALRQGMLINTVTGEIFKGDVGVAFIPATTHHLYVEWIAREKGGGFVAVHQPDSDVVKEAIAASTTFGSYNLPPHVEKESNELIETFYVYGVAIDGDGNAIEAVVPFTSAKIKAYKGWMTKAKTIQIDVGNGRRIPAPLFAHRYRLKSVQDKNPKGTFFNWSISFDGENAMACRLKPSDDLFQKAVAVKKMIDDGTARAAHETQSAGSGTDGEQGAGAGGKPVF